MPIPIRPNGFNSDSESTPETPSLGMGNVDLISLLGGEDFTRRIYQQADANDPEADMLFDLWQCSQIKIAGQRLQDRTYSVLPEYSQNDLLRLRGHGLIEGDRGNLRFTDRAARVIRTMVLGESNHFRKGQVKKPYSQILATSKPSMLTKGAKVAETVEPVERDAVFEKMSIKTTDIKPGHKVNMGEKWEKVLKVSPSPFKPGWIRLNFESGASSDFNPTQVTTATVLVKTAEVLKVAATLEKEAEDQWWRTQPQVRTFSYESDSSPGKYYGTILYDNGKATCNCTGWRMKRSCRHTREVEARPEAEQLRNPKPVSKATPNKPPRPVTNQTPVLPRKSLGDLAREVANKNKETKTPTEPTKPTVKRTVPITPSTFGEEWVKFGLPEGYTLESPHKVNGEVKIGYPNGSVWTLQGAPGEVAEVAWTDYIQKKLGNLDWTINYEHPNFVARNKNNKEKLIFDTPKEAAEAILPPDAKVKAKPVKVKPVEPSPAAPPPEDFDLSEAQKILDEMRPGSNPTKRLGQVAPRILRIADRDL